MWWLLGLIMGAPILWWVFTVLVGALVPLEYSGAAYLRDAIRKRGVDDRLISERSLRDLVRHSLALARARDRLDRDNSLIAEFARRLDDAAVLVACDMEAALPRTPAADSPVGITLLENKVIDQTMHDSADR